jgi:hypothetical protein
MWQLACVNIQYVHAESLQETWPTTQAGLLVRHIICAHGTEFKAQRLCNDGYPCYASWFSMKIDEIDVCVCVCVCAPAAGLKFVEP